MKVLLVGDAVVPSGFAACTHAAADALHAAGHEVIVLGINYHGDPHPYPYPIYPCFAPFDNGRDGFGLGRLPSLVLNLEPDVIVLLNDPWNVKPYLDSLDRQLPEDFTCPPVVGWLAVDSRNQSSAPSLNRLAHVIVWTEFAAHELVAGGYSGPMTVSPLGVDTTLYYPRDRSKSRLVSLPPRDPAHDYDPDDLFIIGVVGRNQPRKRLDLTLEYFAAWLGSGPTDKSNARLYLLIGPTGDKGTDISSLTRYYGLQGRVMVAEPAIGYGVRPDLMPHIYSSFDVYLSTSQAEGWGLPALEAMACGVPCIVPDFGGIGSWVGESAVKIECPTSALTAPMNSMSYTIGGVPSKESTVASLDLLHRHWSHRSNYRQRGLTLAKSLPWTQTGADVVEVLESVIIHTPEDASVVDSAVDSEVAVAVQE